MNKKHLVLFTLIEYTPFVLAQEDSATTVTEEITDLVSSYERPPVNIDLNLGYESNIDLLDKYLYETKYTDNTVMNINANTTFNENLLGNDLSYKTSLNTLLVQADNHDNSSDFIRRSTFSNSLYLNLLSDNQKINFGPTLSLNAEKRYTRPGFFRKRDNVNGSFGFKATLKPNSSLSLSPEVSVGYLDHNGNYVPNNVERFRSEANLQEDRVIYKSNITAVYQVNNYLSLSLPLTLNRDVYKQRKARFAATDEGAYQAMSLVQWSQATGAPYLDPTLDLQTFSTGLTGNINLNEQNSMKIAYTYTDEREQNIGHRFSDSDIDTFNFGFYSTPLDQLKISFDYENMGADYHRLWGGGKEITQSYAGGITLSNIFNTKVSAVLNYSYTDYQITLPVISYQERASNSTAYIGMMTSI